MASVALWLFLTWNNVIRTDTMYEWPIRTWYVPTALLPTYVTFDEEQRAMDTLRDALVRDYRGCTITGYFVREWHPRRLALWLFLRWPLQCEVEHRLQTCARDPCDGIRAESAFRRRDDAHAFELAVRCDEHNFVHGPARVLDYTCTQVGRFWAECVDDIRGVSVTYLASGHEGGLDDVPCAEPWMVAARKVWPPRPKAKIIIPDKPSAFRYFPDRGSSASGGADARR